MDIMNNEKRTEMLIKKYGFDFNSIPKNEIISLINEEIDNHQYSSSSEYIRLLCGYLYCIGDKSDTDLIRKAKYSINMDVGCMIDIEWIDSLENGGIEDIENYVRPRNEIIADFTEYYHNFQADDDD